MYLNPTCVEAQLANLGAQAGMHQALIIYMGVLYHEDSVSNAANGMIILYKFKFSLRMFLELGGYEFSNQKSHEIFNLKLLLLVVLPG